MHQRTRETPKSREFRENKLRTNQPTQAMFTVLEIIIPGVKVQVFETENFPLLPLTEAALWVGRANATKPPLEYFLPEFQQIFESRHLEILQITTSLPTASTKLNEHLTHGLKKAPLWLFLNETSILEWGGVWNSLRYFQSPWNRSEIISQHISSISFLSMRQPARSDHFSLMDWGSALEKGPDQFRPIQINRFRVLYKTALCSTSHLPSNDPDTFVLVVWGELCYNLHAQAIWYYRVL